MDAIKFALPHLALWGSGALCAWIAVAWWRRRG